MHEVHVANGEMLKEIISVNLEMYGQMQKTRTYTGGKKNCRRSENVYKTYTFGAFGLLFFIKNSVALVRERTIPTERPPPVGEVSANFC